MVIKKITEANIPKDAKEIEEDYWFPSPWKTERRKTWIAVNIKARIVYWRSRRNNDERRAADGRDLPEFTFGSRKLPHYTRTMLIELLEVLKRDRNLRGWTYWKQWILPLRWNGLWFHRGGRFDADSKCVRSFLYFKKNNAQYQQHERIPNHPREAPEYEFPREDHENRVPAEFRAPKGPQKPKEDREEKKLKAERAPKGRRKMYGVPSRKGSEISEKSDTLQTYLQSSRIPKEQREKILRLARGHDVSTDDGVRRTRQLYHNLQSPHEEGTETEDRGPYRFRNTAGRQRNREDAERGASSASGAAV